MAVINYFILTLQQKEAAEAFDNENVALGPRAVDNLSPGVGINLNDAAAGVSAGAVVAVTGKWVAPKRIADNQEYITYAPDMVAYLIDKPFAMLESETIFAPQEA